MKAAPHRPTSVERPQARAFLQALRPMPGTGADPGYVWVDAVSRTGAYLSYLGDEPVNWSVDLWALHEEAGDHFIDQWTRESAIGALSPSSLGPSPILVDLGCGSGQTLANLARVCPDSFLAGVDAVPSPLESAHARVPTALLFHASATDLPFGDSTVDGVVALNLLEHLRDDEAALREIRRVLRTGGRAAVVVPFNPGLFDFYDQCLEHMRRYARGELSFKARSAGLVVRRDTFIGCTIYPVFWVVKKRNRWRGSGLAQDDAARRVRRQIESSRRSRLARGAHWLESHLAPRVPLPFGVRELIVLERS